MEKTREQVSDWYENAKPGDRLIYKSGRQITIRAGREAVSTGVLEVRRLFDEGYVDLVQRVNAPAGSKSRKFEYVAVKRATKQPRYSDAPFSEFGLTSERWAA